jgi:hypothetical protein
MPSLSTRGSLLKDINKMIEMLVLQLYDPEYQKYLLKNLDELIELRIGILCTRIIAKIQPIPKDKKLQDMLFYYPDRDFRQMARMDKRSFVLLVQALKNHSIFKNSSKHKQDFVFYQVLVTLSRLGCSRNVASIGSNARMTEISHGTVCIFTTRVITTILSLHNRYIYWPDAEERASISRRFEQKYCLGGAVGIVDGTPLVFSQRPHVDGEVFWTRKSVYAMNLQLVCYDKKRIRFYQAG